MKILKLDFKKTEETIDSANYGHVDLSNKENLKNIEQYILPIIAKNEGWGTKELTIEGFKQNPFQYQEDLDASLFANVTIALDDNDKPVGLLEYLKETLESPVSVKRMQYINEIVHNREMWETLISREIVDKEIVDGYFPELKDYLKNKNIYSEIGIVVKPELQGKKSGVTEILYEVFSDGIVFGWTSNPLYIAQCHKYFKKTIYFPLFEERITDLEGIATLAILYGDLLTYNEDRLLGLKFGAIKSPYFVSSRDNYYLELAKSLVNAKKITELDKKRIKYCIDNKFVQSAVFAFSQPQ